MATRRVRKTRRKGGVRPGKLKELNTRNCERYWSSSSEQGKEPSRCENTSLTYDYPGFINKYFLSKVVRRRGKEGNPIMGDNDIVSGVLY